MRTIIAVVFGMLIATAGYYQQNPAVVLESPETIMAFASTRASSLEKVPDSFASIAATSTPVADSRTVNKPTSQQSSKPDRTEDSADRVLELEQKVHFGINAARATNGASPQLRWDDRLGAVARAHSEDMTTRGYFDHDNPEGLGPSDRIDKAGYNCWKGSHYGVAENITIELVSSSLDRMADGAVQSWLNSPGHRTNLLGRQYDRTGIGASFGTWRGYKAVYVTQVFC